MNFKQNLHTHCIYCDGKDTPEEIIAYALEKGFDSIGFSCHSYAPYAVEVSSTPEKIQQYRREITRLKEVYADRLRIYLGLEYDMYCGQDQSGYDYLIGSVHYLKTPDGIRDFDCGAQWVQNFINTYYGGDGLQFAKAYYEAVAELPAYGKFDILGHFDLITKGIETIPYFDPGSKVYLDAALGAMEALRGKIPYFEVNSGAIARGVRTSPYPAVNLMRAFREMGFLPVITSDCHDGRYLDCHFEESAALLRACGFKEKYILTEEGFQPVKL